MADTFVDSIETITSQEKEVLVKDKETGKNKIVMAKVWNKTVVKQNCIYETFCESQSPTFKLNCHQHNYFVHPQFK